MNLIFCYVLADQKQLVYNNKVLENALFIKDFKIFVEKYYLANTRYHNTNYLLYFQYSVCYYLRKQADMRKKLVNKEKLFNFYFSSLYNIVERIFRVTKQYFQIFKLIFKYHYNIQINLFFAIIVLHNFVYIHQSKEDIYDKEQKK